MTDLNFITHVLGANESIESYTRDLTEEDFIKNFLVQDAVVRNLEIIGEAAKKISPGIKTDFPEIPGRKSRACGIN